MFSRTITNLTCLASVRRLQGRKRQLVGARCSFDVAPVMPCQRFGVRARIEPEMAYGRHRGEPHRGSKRPWHADNEPMWARDHAPLWHTLSRGNSLMAFQWPT